MVSMFKINKIGFSSSFSNEHLQMDSKEAGESKMFHIISTLAAGPIFTTQNSAETTLEMHC